jgi:two-component system OmpR family response regulator
MNRRILVIEDEEGIADFIKRGLETRGYVVETVSDGSEGEQRALTGDADLLILDRLLPGRDGLQILASVRLLKPALPVIMLTALGEVSDRIDGLEGGATDYMSKPFALAELAARVGAHLRQHGRAPNTRLLAGEIDMDLLTRTVRRAGAEIPLSPTEFDLLAYFLRHPGEVVTRPQLLNVVWGYDHDPGTNIVEVYVGYLRRKLELAGRPAPITTLRSIGYRLDANS